VSGTVFCRCDLLEGNRSLRGELIGRRIELE
jgi:hypothetical protein